MRKILVAFVVALACSAAVTAQQIGARGSFPGCPTCGVWSYVDLPAPEATVSASSFVVQGWGFECTSGRAIDRIDVFYQDYDGFWRPLRQPQTALNWGSGSRPDVWYAYAGMCPLIGDHTGWTLQIVGAPLGLRRIQFTIWRGPYYEVHRRTYLIQP